MTETHKSNQSHDGSGPTPTMAREPTNVVAALLLQRARIVRDLLNLAGDDAEYQDARNEADLLERSAAEIGRLQRERAAEGEQRERMEQQQADLIRDAERWRAVRETAITQTIFPNGDSSSWLYTRVLAGIIRTPDEYADTLREQQRAAADADSYDLSAAYDALDAGQDDAGGGAER